MGRAPSLWLFAAALAASPAEAQDPGPAPNQGLVVRDGTLGEGPEEVGPDPLDPATSYLITPQMGEQRGGNLFHSFARFSIGEDETATFTGPDDIDHVISRVTGSEASEIDGTLRSTIPGADVWLLNPSGVVFGEGATLDVPGSFHASTGDSLGFEGGIERFYVDDRPSSVLSTATPEAFGFLGEHAAQPITVTGATLATVRAGDGLELVGGDVTLTRATLDAPGGAISIRGGRIVVDEGSKVLAENVDDAPAGSIIVAASESVLVDNGVLSVNTSGAGHAGTIEIKGLGEGHPSPDVTFQNGIGYDPPVWTPTATDVGARAETTGAGAAGTIRIDATNLLLQKGVAVSAGSVGTLEGAERGRGGTVTIRARSVELLERSSIHTAAWGSLGGAGTIDIELADGGSLLVDARAQAHEGSGAPYAFLISQNTGGSPGRIAVRGGSVALLNGGSITTACNSPCGDDAGSIAIDADSVILDGGGIRAGTSGPGDAGTIAIDADWVGVTDGGMVSASTDGSGRGGTIVIDAISMNVTAGGIAVDTRGSGDAGTITMKVRDSLNVTEGGFINAITFGSGKAGAISIDADSVLLRGSREDWNEGRGSLILVSTQQRSTGDGGDIVITARALAVEAEGLISAGSLSVPIGEDVPRAGKAGTILIDARESISVSNEDGELFSLSRALLGRILFEPLTVTGILGATVFGGNGGAITLLAPKITVSHGALVGSSTVGGGDAGPVLLRGDEIRVVDGGIVSSASLRLFNTFLGGKGGDVRLVANESIEVAGVDPQDPARENRSSVAASTIGSGPAGTVTLRAPRIVIEDDGIVQSTALRAFPALDETGGPIRTSGEARGGDVVLDATEQVIVRSGGLVDASSFVADRAGEVTGGVVAVTAGDSILVEGDGSRIESRTGGGGTGGDVVLHAPHIEIAHGGVVSARSAPGYEGVGGAILARDGLVPRAPAIARGNAGSVTLAADRLFVTGGTIATSAAALQTLNADGGNVVIEAKSLVHLDAGVISASVNGGAGGDISVLAPDAMILENDSRIDATTTTGTGGNITIDTDNYFAFPGSVVDVDASSDVGVSGTVEVNTPDVNLAGQLAALPTSYLDAASQMRAPCAARRSGERSGSFAVRGPDGIPPEPDGWLPATAGLAGAADLVADPPAGPRSTALLAATRCR